MSIIIGLLCMPFFDTKGKVQYIGKAYYDVWRRPHAHVRDNDIPDDWTILVLYGKLWIYSHEWAESELHDKFPNAKHWD